MWKFLKYLFVLLLLVLPATVPGQIDYTTNNGTITITGYTGSVGTLTIPATINGLPVTGIGDEAFLNCASLTSVTISNGVTSIGKSAFYNCTSLTSVIIPNSVTNIGDEAFVYCTSLLAISVDSSNSVYSSLGGVLFNNSETTLIQFPGGKAGDYAIPDSVTNIARYAFVDCTSLTSVTIPPSVNSIGDDQFLYCTSLTSVTIPDGISSIGFCAFADCFSLTSVSIADSVASIGNAAFYNCVNLTNVSIPDSVTNIDANVFYWCTNLLAIEVDPENPVYSSLAGVLFDKSQTTLVNFPAGNAGSYTISNSVTNVASYAFVGCNQLTSITIPGSVTTFGYYAFSYCQNLLGVYFQGNAPKDSFPYSPPIFQGDTNATIYYLQGSTGWAATFELLPTVKWNPQVLAQLTYTTNGGTLTITAFTGSGGAVVIPVTINGIPIASIGTNAFGGCTNLTGITFPSTITMLDDSAFAGCTALTSVAVPGGATGAGVFSNCLALTNVVLANNVTSIGNWEFSGCLALPTITIPGSVTNIGDFAFNNCYSLSSVYFLGNAPNADSTVFTGDGSVTNYYFATTSGWGATFAGRPTVPVVFMTVTNSGAITITRYLGPGGSVVVPDSINGLPVTGIANGAFSGYTNVINITIGSNIVNTAAGLAFVGCSSLQAIFVNAMNPVYSSTAGVLFNKSQTTLIFCPNGISGAYSIPNNVSSVGNYAFEYCGGLTSVTFPGSVTNIGTSAFNGCNRLKSYYFLGNAPNADFEAFGVTPNATIYYMPGTTGWNEQAQINGAGINPQTNLFGFSITGAGNLVIVVEACTNLAKPFWSALSTNTLSSTPFYFSDSSWTNYPRRFYLVQNFLAFIGISEVLWDPHVQTSGATFGVQSNQFGFTITGSSNLLFTVEACTNLGNPVWTPLATDTLAGGLYYFSDPQWTNYPIRFYRISPP
jgi:hypothetical protein